MLQPAAAMPARHCVTLRVRYCECDPMGVVHHTVIPVWFEIGRTEMLRATGVTYRDLEERGFLLAVTRLSVTYKQPARYDDELTLETLLGRVGMAKVEHSYRLLRGETLLAAGESTLACLDTDGRVQMLPEFLREPKR